MTWTVTSYFVPMLCTLVAGWFLRGWWEWRAVAKASAKIADGFRTDIHWGL